MIKRELKSNLKSLFVWTLLLIFIFAIVYLIYPSIMSSENGISINQMLESFPKELLQAFNMDISGIDKVSGWFRTEGFVLTTLLISVYSALLGGNILLKEENDKTIEYLAVMPVKRSKIVTSRVITGFLNIIFITVFLTLFHVIGMALSNDLHLKELLFLNLGPLLIYLSIFSITLFISTFFRKSKSMTGISIGIVFLSYFLQVVSGISESYGFIKYFSLFTLAESRYMILHLRVHPISILIGILLIVISLGLTYYNYNRKEFL